MEVLSFRIADEHYAVQASIVRRIPRSPQIARLRLSDGVLVGLTTLDERLVPVFDLARLLDLGAEADDRSQIVALGTDECELALLAEDLQEGSEIEVEALRAVPWPLAAENARLVLGVTKEGVVVLDAQALLEDRRLFLDDGRLNEDRLDESDDPAGSSELRPE